MNLENVQGVGPRLASAIRDHMPDEEFFAAASRQDLHAIQQAAGVSPRRAVELVRRINGTPLDDFAATPQAAKLADQLLERVQSFAATEFGRNRIQLLGPLPSEAAARERIQHVLLQKARVKDMDRAAVKAALRKLQPLRQPAPVANLELAVVAGSDDAYDRLHGLGVGQWAMLCTQNDPSHQEATLSIFAYDGQAGPDTDLELDAGAPLADYAPAAFLLWVEHNRATLEACDALAALTSTESLAAELLPMTMPSAQLDERAIHATAIALLDDINTQLEADMENLSVSAADMMRAMSQGTLPAPVRDAVQAAIKGARSTFVETTSLDFQPFEPTFPVTLDEQGLTQAIDARQSRSAADAHLAAARMAKKIAKAQEGLQAEVAHWLEFDADFALGCFARHYDLRAPTFGQVLSFSDSIHLDLADRPEAARIAYHLGKDAPVAILTGANSGGKSTLLEHVCQLVLSARMGLPVVGDVSVPWYDELHLITARKGLDAGAFETFLRTFMPIAEGDARRLVLADEVESVTELEAAGRILAFWLDRLARTQSHAIVVSHMAQPILSHATQPVRVDGIEAQGLDENNQLIVDRTPRMGVMAKSTPELIIQRLVATQKGASRALFEDLLEAMAGSKTRK